MENEMNSVEDIDSMLEEQFEVIEETHEEENVTENAEEIENENSNQEGQDDHDDETEGEEEPPASELNEAKEVVKKPSSEEKKEYAFGELRKENANLKKSNDFLKSLAKQYGYDDVDKFQEAVDKSRMQQEAKTKGIDPVIYEEQEKMKREIAELKADKQRITLENRASAFKNAVDNAVTKYDLGTDGRNEIFNKLEEQGYTVDTILSLPNPEIVIKGILSERIVEISKQKELKKKETLDNLADEKHGDTMGSQTDITVDELIKQEMEEYKKANFYS